LSSVDSSVLLLDYLLFDNLVTVVGTESFNKFMALTPTVERAGGTQKTKFNSMHFVLIIQVRFEL
jgi:hypothetical protein